MNIAPGSPIQRDWLEEIAWQSFTYYPRLRKVNLHLHDHLSDKIAASDAARIACCEAKYFSAYFHAKVDSCGTIHERCRWISGSVVGQDLRRRASCAAGEFCESRASVNGGSEPLDYTGQSRRSQSFRTRFV